MGRPLRIEFENAVYHITSRGNERKKIYRDDGDNRIGGSNLLFASLINFPITKKGTFVLAQ